MIDNLHKRLMELRQDNDYTQSDVGRAINVSQRTYSYYENGQRTISPQTLCKLASFYNTSVDYILGLTDIKKPYPRKK